MSRKVIAIFGGAFNPPINSHLYLAKQIVAKCKEIEKIVFVPVSTKYRKANLASDEHRFNMLKLMCDGELKLDVSDIELNYNRQLYTIETLDLMKKQYGDKYNVYFIMGTDNLKKIDTWREPERLLKEYKIIVLARDNDDINKIIKESNLLMKYKESIVIIDNIDRVTLSSTLVRNKIKNNEDIKGYVPRKVLEYIKDNNLYK